MRVRHKPWAKETLQHHQDIVIPEAESVKGSWQELFDQTAPLHLEIGTGKGQFLAGMAAQYPQVHFIGIELAESIIVTALQKILHRDLNNVRLIHGNAKNLPAYFAESEVDEIYLNFSDPWPKTRHEKRRLTYQTFLQQYEYILKQGGWLHFKTDNRGLFEYSLESFREYGMELADISWDLHARQDPWNVMTTYEEKFAAKGQPIYRCQAQFHK